MTSARAVMWLGVVMVGMVSWGCAGQSPPAEAGLPGMRAAVKTVASDRIELQPALPDGATLGDLLRYAEEHHPALSAARWRWEAARNQVPQARTLPDPSLNLGYESMDRETRIGLSQMFPFPGKLALRGEVAEAGVHIAQQRLEAERREVLRRVADAWAEYAYLGRTIDIARRNLELVRQLEQVAHARVRAGAPQADLLRAQIELARIEDELRTAEDLLTPAAARLNAALGRPGDAAVPRLDPHDAPENVLDEARLLSQLRQASPELRALRLESEQARRSVQLARRETLPDFMIGVDYMREPDQDGVGLMFSISLPIWRDRYRAAVRQAANQFNAANYMLVDRQNALEADLQMALYNLRDARRKMTLYRDTLLPRAEQSLRASEAAYRAGTVDFLTVVEAYRLPLEFELALVRAQTQYAQRLAEIESIVGQAIETDTNSEQPQTE